jgi:hypothetical protein
MGFTVAVAAMATKSAVGAPGRPHVTVRPTGGSTWERPNETSTMSRWSMPAICVLILLGTALGLGILPLKAEEASCHATAFQFYAGKELPHEHHDECHEKAKVTFILSAATATTGVLAAVASVVILGGRPSAEEERAAEEAEHHA